MKQCRGPQAILSSAQAPQPHWIKTKNPDAPAEKREAEEDWDGWSARPGHYRRWRWDISAAMAAATCSSIAPFPAPGAPTLYLELIPRGYFAAVCVLQQHGYQFR